MTTDSTPDQAVSAAAALIQAGKLVAFPTETVYGLGADATNTAAVQAIFKVKGRPPTNPLIVHVASFNELLQCVDFAGSSNPQHLRAKLEALNSLWPGPLSVVVPKAAHISDAVSAGGSSVALRIPRHPLALQLLKLTRRPVAAPSANPSTYISPTTAKHVREGLGDKVAYILDGGPCAVGIESTVVSLLEETPTILRPGAVTREQLEAALGCPVRSTVTHQEGSSTPLLSPGLLAKHYAPCTPVCLLPEFNSEKVKLTRIGAILFSKDTVLPFKPLELRFISECNELNEVAANLFAALRELDALHLEQIVVDTCEPVGLGAAIMDRLLRASAR
jgi:L-threonylcarbamoyladenylate synthase